jgi:hypothetical protein
MRAQLLLCALCACGGTAVVDGSGQGGKGQGGSGSTTTTTTPTKGCDDHNDCPGGLCVFSTGTCAPPCGDICSPCGPGLVCDGCATSSCPGCLDCGGACLAAAPGQCDDHDDCAQDEVCLYGTGKCAPTCGASACADPNMICDACATAGCPCCKNCGAACLPL